MEKLRSICRTMDAGGCTMLDGAAGGSTVVLVTQCRLGGALGHLHWATDSRRTGGLRPKSSGSIADLHLSRSS